MNKSEFIAREVWNQGWRDEDYFVRVGMMGDAWESVCSTTQINPLETPLSNRHIKTLAWMLEPANTNINKWRTCNVSIGGRLCPPPDEIEDLMRRWQNNLSSMTPLEAYKEFEYIHPFVDGNGRVGKIIYNVLMGTMDNPTFPHVPEWGEG